MELVVNPDSRQTIHVGINFVFLPIPTIDPRISLRFQEALLSVGIDGSRADLKPQEITIVREPRPRLEIKVGAVIGSPLGQLLIVSPGPSTELDLFTKDAHAVIAAFSATWPVENRQVIRSDVTIRDLYEATGEHAFKELWEVRLQQAETSLARLGRPVLGGGLRLVMPPVPSEQEPTQIEVKIESFLRDTKKMFVETQFTWPQPSPVGAPLDPTPKLKAVDEYVENQVESFILGGA
jgi:hypothetical protein